MTTEPAFDAKKAWTMLGLGVTAQVTSTVFMSTPAFLIPLLHNERGMSLTRAGVIASAPNLGIVLSLIAWGVIIDRYGERSSLIAGLLLTAAAAGAAMIVDSYAALGICLLVGGMACGSTSAASGKLVMGWFPRDRRGFAMGVRQMSQPLGVTIAALSVPALAHHGIAAAMSVALVMCAALALACLGVRNPAPAGPSSNHATTSPYKDGNFLWRIHATSVLLVVPQFVVATFGLVWLVSQLHFDEFVAGTIVAASQFAGALGRIGVGVLSDKAQSRVQPLRWVALSAIAVMILLAFGDFLTTKFAAATLIIAVVVTVADNGLAFTSVAEAAGRAWSGRALGVQNTGQFLAAAAVGPAAGALIGATNYGWTFLFAALCPIIAVPLIPNTDVHRDDT